MAEPTQCPKCGTPLVPAADGPSCPRCLLAAGLESGGAADPASAAAPSAEEMGKHFPQLEILELLGQGGMGLVYKAKQKSLDRIVALKVLAPEAAREAGFADRFSREARTLARLQHPNIVGVHDFGSADGLFYLVMEFVDGANLRQAIRTGKLSAREALAIVPQVCDALQYAHDQGVVHRDIKPENILVDRSGRVRIADFGLAKIVQRTPVDMTITRAGQVMGTLHYMAPEQYRTPDSVDHRADIYSLGVVFYEMLTGELPLGSFPMPSSKAGVDVRLDKVVMRALESERDRRWQHASEMKTHVSAIAEGAAAAPPTPAAAPTAAAAAAAPAAVPAPPPAPDPAVHPLAFWGGLGIPLALGAGFLGWLLVRPFGSGHAASWTGALFLSATAMAGWIASMIGWGKIHHDRARWKGLGWAITGTFLPPVLFCAGGYVAPVFVWLGSPTREARLARIAGKGMDMPGITIGEDGIHMPGIDIDDKGIRAPGVEINDKGIKAPGVVINDKGIRAPGVTIEDGAGGGRVKMPGVEAEDKSKDAVVILGEPKSWTATDRDPLLRAAKALWAERGEEFLTMSFEQGMLTPRHYAARFRLDRVVVQKDACHALSVWMHDEEPVGVEWEMELKDGAWVGSEANVRAFNDLSKPDKGATSSPK